MDEERLPVWHRIQADGQIRYRLNADHPVFSDFTHELSEAQQRRFLRCLGVAAASLPIETLHADLSGIPEQVVADRVDEETLAQAVRSTISLLSLSGKDMDQILKLMKDVDPFRSAWQDTKRLIALTTKGGRSESLQQP